MRIHILGSAAGGGVPQWNCNCANCRAARRKSQSSVLGPQSSKLRRTQSSVAVSSDGERWILLNASPDLPAQFASFPALSPSHGKLRGSAIAAVVLTDGELDHVTGLLSLREDRHLRLVCTRAVRALLTDDFPLLPALQGYLRLEHFVFPATMAGLRFAAIDVSTKAPPYAKRVFQAGGAVGLQVEDAKRKRGVAYLPALPAITEDVEALLAGCDCLLIDGTFWSNDEMTSLGLTRRTARDMGHLPISGPGGSLEWLRALPLPRKIYIHINNTNPILRHGSRERRMVERAGVEIAYDGMDIRV